MMLRSAHHLARLSSRHHRAVASTRRTTTRLLSASADGKKNNNDNKDNKDSNTNTPPKGIWDSFKDEASKNEDLRKMVHSLQDQAAKAAKHTEMFANRTRKHIPNVESLHSSKVQQLLNGVRDTFKNVVDKTSSVFGSARRDLESRFEKTVESVDPAVVERATRIRNVIRETSDKVVTPAVKVGSVAASALKDVAKEIISPEEEKLYSKREKREKLEREIRASGVSTHESDKTAAPLSDETAITIVKRKEGEWEKQFRLMREKVQATPAYKKVSDVLDATGAKISETKVYKKGQDAKQKIDDKIEDLRDQFETTQNPVVWAVRDSTDEMFTESDTAVATSELRRIDPEFTMEGFLEEMEHFMIPKFLKAYLGGDMTVLAQTCGGEAMAHMRAMMIQRQTLGVHYDERILDISDINIANIKMDDGSSPFILLTFMCQHINCARDMTGKIVEGSENEIRSTFVSWALTRDLENDDFNWRIMELHVQGVTALI